ncbi:MAG: TIGR02147 family protein [Fibrobacterota bacterium]|nr:TIGR02147 family protein [Fibrobacterota bacterium]QQS06882.1 MAG: TIGR02147 family protein [Fibrobacterota bacterium]
MDEGFDYSDYRDLLCAAFDRHKSADPQFSYKMLAEALGMDTAGTFRVLHKERHLPARSVSRAIDFLGLSGRAAEYFVLMNSYARERGRGARQAILDKANELRDVPRRRLEDQELSFFRDWWMVAVRCAVEVLEGRANPEEIARRIVPAVEPEAIRQAIQVMLDLGIAKKSQGERLRFVDKHLTADAAEGRAAVAQFQRKILEMAGESVHRFPREGRDISTLTLTVDEAAFQDVREILRDCRRRIQQRVGEAETPDRVLQVAIAIFPLMPALGET